MNTRSKIIQFAAVASVFATVPLIVALLLQAPRIGHAADTQPVPDHVVYPTGVFPDDVRNVQSAVNQGGTVLLKATNTSGQLTAFNFGPNGPTTPATRRVFVFSNEVTVIGETVGGQMTTIRGGSAPFWLFALPGTQTCSRRKRTRRPRIIRIRGKGMCFLTYLPTRNLPYEN